MAHLPQHPHLRAYGRANPRFGGYVFKLYALRAYQTMCGNIGMAWFRLKLLLFGILALALLALSVLL